MTNDEKLLEKIAELDGRLKVLETFKAKYEADMVVDGVCLDGAPEYIRDYVQKEKEGSK